MFFLFLPAITGNPEGFPLKIERDSLSKLNGKAFGAKEIIDSNVRKNNCERIWFL